MELRVQAPALYRKGVLFADVILKADLFCTVNKLLEAYRPKGPQYNQYPLCCAQMKVCPGNAFGIGGKFLEDESPDDCLLRETLEETGLTLTSYRYRGIVTFVNTKYPSELMHLFTADGYTGALRDCDEGVLEWIDRDRLSELTLWEGDKIFLDLLRRDTPFFSLKLRYDGDTLLEAVLDGKPMQI